MSVDPTGPTRELLALSLVKSDAEPFCAAYLSPFSRKTKRKKRRTMAARLL
jgi:hypothetical protein